MIPNYESIITGAGTDGDGEIYFWQGADRNCRGRSLFRDRNTQACYAVSISPTGRYLAAGSKVGLIRIWPFLDQSFSGNVPFLFEIYHYLCPVTSLTFLTDDLLLSSGGDGRISFISIHQQKHIKNIEAHDGPICTTVALGNRVIASLGIDGKVKIWDLDTLMCEFEIDGVVFPRDTLSLFPALGYSPDTGYLCFPSMDGHVHLLNLRNSCRHETILGHDGIFYSIATCGQYLITGGMKDKKLKLWDLRKKSLVNEIETGSVFLKISPLGKEKIVSICIDPSKTQSLRIFSLPQLKPMNAMKNLNLRSIATLPIPVIEDLKRGEIIQTKNKLIEQARANILNPDKMKSSLIELARKGFWAEAKFLQAESARIRNRPLHELGFLLQLTQDMSISQGTAPIIYRLASLLEQLNEPDLAIQHYEKIKNFIDEVKLRIKRLNSHPLLCLDPFATVRSDLSAPRFAVQEMEKDSVLGRPFRWRVIMPIGELSHFRICSLKNLHLWETHINQSISSMSRRADVIQEKLILFDGRKTRETKWLIISKIGIHTPSPFLDYAIEIIQETGYVQGYCIFNPNKKLGSAENVTLYNVLLAREYRLTYQQRTVEIWFKHIHEAMKSLDKQISYRRN